MDFGVYMFQMHFYGHWWWLFIGMAAIAGFLRKKRWVLCAHFLVCAVVLYMDFEWLKVEIGSLSWDALMSAEKIFYVGVLGRLMIVNGLLLIADWIGWEIGAKFSQTPLRS